VASLAAGAFPLPQRASVQADEREGRHGKEWHKERAEQDKRNAERRREQDKREAEQARERAKERAELEKERLKEQKEWDQRQAERAKERRNDYRRNDHRRNDYRRNELSTIEGVVSSDGFLGRRRFRINHVSGGRINVQVQGGTPGNLDPGDRVRLFGRSSNGIFYAQRVSILRDRSERR
jgi:ATPase subunit of ABC transporter with duplicated ATPase domains